MNDRLPNLQTHQERLFMMEYLKTLIQGFTIIHGLVILIAGVFHLWLWARRRFWVPRYVHIIAAIALVIAIFLGWMGFSIGNVNNPEKAIRVCILMIILFPSIVYFFFVFYGGVEAAYKSRMPRRENGEINQ